MRFVEGADQLPLAEDAGEVEERAGGRGDPEGAEPASLDPGQRTGPVDDDPVTAQTPAVRDRHVHRPRNRLEHPVMLAGVAVAEERGSGRDQCRDPEGSTVRRGHTDGVGPREYAMKRAPRDPASDCTPAHPHVEKLGVTDDSRPPRPEHRDPEIHRVYLGPVTSRICAHRIHGGIVNPHSVPFQGVRVPICARPRTKAAHARNRVPCLPSRLHA